MAVPAAVGTLVKKAGPLVASQAVSTAISAPSRQAEKQVGGRG